jgi:hypothetical protein
VQWLGTGLGALRGGVTGVTRVTQAGGSEQEERDTEQGRRDGGGAQDADLQWKHRRQVL